MYCYIIFLTVRKVASRRKMRPLIENDFEIDSNESEDEMLGTEDSDFELADFN